MTPSKLTSMADAIARFVPGGASVCMGTALEAAIRIARLHAIAGLRDAAAEIDGEAIRAALAAVRAELEAIKGIKSTLTSIARGTADVQATLDRLREGILARIAEAETEIRRQPVA